jgi:type II secretory pathway pseudopilin PulG
MDNLIAITIAIALVAVMALLGANYGTQAIMSYQAQIEATKIVSDAERIAAAWKSYARANNGDPSLSSAAGYCWGNNGATDLVSNYLSALPTPPSAAADSTFNYYFPALYKKFNINGSGAKLGPTYTPADSIALWVKSPRVCQAIVNLAGQNAAVISGSLTQTPGGGDLDLSGLSTPRAVVSPFDCIYNGTGSPVQGNLMLFIYRVFDQNSFTATARAACS